MARRLFIDQDFIKENQIRLNEEAFHYLKRVLRVKQGETLEVFNKKNQIATAEVSKIEKNGIEIKIVSFQEKAIIYPRQNLAVAVCSPQKLSLIVQKATELAVENIWLLETRFSQNQQSHLLHSEDKLKRYRQIILSACQQSGVTRVPSIHRSQKIETWLEQGVYEGGLVLADPQGESYLDKITSNTPHTWVIGPEGGFSQEEKQQILDKKATRVCLAPAILRMETACISALTLGHQVSS